MLINIISKPLLLG